MSYEDQLVVSIWWGKGRWDKITKGREIEAKQAVAKCPSNCPFFHFQYIRILHCVCIPYAYSPFVRVHTLIHVHLSTSFHHLMCMSHYPALSIATDFRAFRPRRPSPTVKQFCAQAKKAYMAKTSCNQLLLIDWFCSYMLIKIYWPVVTLQQWASRVRWHLTLLSGVWFTLECIPTGDNI